MNLQTEQILSSHGIHPTALRILIYETLSCFSGPFSLSDVDARLETVDQSTIFRCLRVFLEAGLIHDIDDGSQSRKYCLCRCDDGEVHSSHLHFTCLKCHRTYCIKEVHIPRPHLPEGFDLSEITCVAKGLCPDCSGK